MTSSSHSGLRLAGPTARVRTTHGPGRSWLHVTGWLRLPAGCRTRLRCEGAATAAAAVSSACDALVAGLDTPSLRMLAGLTRAEAAYHVPELMAAALSELGLDFYPPGSRSGQEAAVRALAGQAVSGSLTPQTLAAAVHQHFGHRLPLAERLATLDDSMTSAITPP